MISLPAKDNAERPAEPLYRAVQDSDLGWPYCFYDYGLKRFLANPEYGGDGKDGTRCAKFTPPVAAFPAHWAPVDIEFYTGNQFPAKYRGGVFIAFHGVMESRAAAAGRLQRGEIEVFANGFVGKSPLMNPNDAVARPDGVAQAPDGSLYVGESQKGKVWRVMYTGR